jgi:hypothetical protein
MNDWRSEQQEVPRFNRAFFRSGRSFSRIGGGEIGGKARGLVFIRDILEEEFGPEKVEEIAIDIPTFVVIATNAFDAFIERNGLRDVALSDLPDDRIAHAFQQGELPAEILGDLRAITEEVRSPLAVRSSSLLEDALSHPFAGIYETKMTPNNQPDPQERFRKLAEAVKFVYASTYFRGPKNYVRATRKSIEEEKMAVILQEVVGQKYHERFYPTLSGVCRSYNFYPMGGAKPEEGVVNLALGLGKTIVDGGLSYSYSPARPKAPPPFGSVNDMMKLTQRNFWAVNVGKPPPYNPIAETEYLVRAELANADYDGTLPFVASTYLPGSDRMCPGTGPDGPRVITFAPLLQLQEFPLNAVLRRLMSTCERAVGRAVEIELAMTLPKSREAHEARLRFLQVRPMMVSEEEVVLTPEELDRPDLLLASNRALGNGVVDTIRDVVYVKPEPFHQRHSRAIADQLEHLNAPLLTAGRPYLLIGFGRWGSTDPWLGIPVNWGQISGARVIVEATLPDLAVEPSQGTHFFHNLTSFQVSYLHVSHLQQPGIDWKWLEAQTVVSETEFVRHVQLEDQLLARIDGRSSRGAVWQRP